MPGLCQCMERVLTYVRLYLLTYLLTCLLSYLLNSSLTYFPNYLLTYLLTPCSTVLLEKLTGFQLVKKFPTFYGTQRFITAFTSARHLSLSWASSIPSITPHPTSWRSILILSPIYAWVSQAASFPQVSLPKPCIRLSSPPIHATCPAHLILLDLITRTILGEQYRSFSQYNWR